MLCYHLHSLDHKLHMTVVHEVRQIEAREAGSQNLAVGILPIAPQVDAV